MAHNESISWYKKIISFLYPLVLKEIDSPIFLQFVLKNNRIILNSKNANQSNGTLKYALHQAFSHFKWYKKPNVNQILILGFGMGSAYDLLSPIFPAASFTGIEKDDNILAFYKKNIPYNLNLTLKSLDANDFIKNNKDSFDLILIDLFNDDEIPHFVFDTTFLEQCHQALKPQGEIILNSLKSNNIEEKHPTIQTFFDTFWDSITDNRFYWKGK